VKSVSTRLAAAFLCVLPLIGVFSESVVGSGAILERPDHPERVVGSRVLMDLLGRVDDLQHEIRELRGQVEVQAHALSQMEQSQRNYYLDLDNRLRQVEVATGAGATSPRTFDVPSTKTPPSVESDAAGIAEKSVGIAEKSVRTEKPRNDSTVDDKPTNSKPGYIDATPNREQDTAYREAFDLLRRRSYAQAITALKAFQDLYPSSQYTEDVQYWLGEAYYVTRQFQLALGLFQKFPSQYPTSSKISDALLKIGYIQDELGRKTEAKRTFDNLIQQYPDSTQAHLARKRLQKIQGKVP